MPGGVCSLLEARVSWVSHAILYHSMLCNSICAVNLDTLPFRLTSQFTVYTCLIMEYVTTVQCTTVTTVHRTLYGVHYMVYIICTVYMYSLYVLCTCTLYIHPTNATCMFIYCLITVLLITC